LQPERTRPSGGEPCAGVEGVGIRSSKSEGPLTGSEIRLSSFGFSTPSFPELNPVHVHQAALAGVGEDEADVSAGLRLCQACLELPKLIPAARHRHFDGAEKLSVGRARADFDGPARAAG